MRARGTPGPTDSLLHLPPDTPSPTSFTRRRSGSGRRHHRPLIEAPHRVGNQLHEPLEETWSARLMREWRILDQIDEDKLEVLVADIRRRGDAGQMPSSSDTDGQTAPSTPSLRRSGTTASTGVTSRPTHQHRSDRGPTDVASSPGRYAHSPPRGRHAQVSIIPRADRGLVQDRHQGQHAPHRSGSGGLFLSLAAGHGDGPRPVTLLPETEFAAGLRPHGLALEYRVIIGRTVT